MSETIWKFPLPLLDDLGLANDRPVINMPEGARILTLQVQYDEPTLWAIVDPDQKLISRRFIVVGTGHEVPPDVGAYVGTWQPRGFVFHLFEAL
jgi:hypothetical protein